MNICTDRTDECIAGVDGVVCPHSRPHDRIANCSHRRFRCTQFAGKQHRCKRFRPERSDFKVFAKIDTFLVIGVVKAAELLRLISKYGTRCRNYSDESIRVALPKMWMEAFVPGMN